MPVKKIFYALSFAVSLFLLPFLVQAQDSPSDDLSPVCADMRAQAMFEQADHQLNASYKKLIKIMSVPKDKYLDYPTLKTKFIEAQRQWLQFRDKECDAWYLINQAGTQRNSDQMSCLIQRTQDRTRQLTEWMMNLS